jgi:hypothetical protein
MEHGKPFKMKDAGFFDGGSQFFRIPACIMESKELTPLEKLLWVRLFYHGWEYNRIYPRQETLAAEVGGSVRGVQKSLESLRVKGFIEWTSPPLTSKKRKQANEYRLLWRSEFERSGEQSHEQSSYGSSKSHEQSSYGSHEQSAYESHEQSSSGGVPADARQSGDEGQFSGPEYENLQNENEKTNTQEAPGGGVCSIPDPFESEEAIGGNGGSGPTAKQEFDTETEEYIERKSRQEGKPPARFERWLRKEARKNGGWLDFPESELNQLRENDGVDTGPDPEFTDPPIEKLREVAEQWKREERGEISQPDPTEQRSKVQQEIIEQMEDGLRHGCTVQAAADMLVLDRENFLPSYRIDYVRQQMHNIYPSEVNTALLKAQLMRKVKASFRGPDERTKALQQLQRLDPERGARLKEETGVCDAIF